MKKNYPVWILTLTTLFAFSPFAVAEISRQTKNDLYSQIELYSYTLTTIQADYVDEKEPKDLIYGSLKGMLSSLDPHSQFLDPEEYKELRTETQGKFGGLGIEISIRDGLLTIITPLEDTPAWKAGIKALDRIVKIDDEVTKDITLSDAVKKLRGKPGTDVRITILREKEGKILEFTITREIIHIQDVKHVQVLENNIGYLRLSEFREDSAKSFRDAIEQLAKEGADSLILDLRNNPGGLLNVAIKISEEFLPDGMTIVSTKGRRESQNTVSKSTNRSHVIDWPTVVLINEGSASGSEILAGALKDNKRAIILGEKSFGKGSVQSVIPLPDGSGLRLTTSKYFTPSGVCIHGIGIEPDIVVDFVPPQDKEQDAQEEKIDEIFSEIDGKERKDKKETKEETRDDRKQTLTQQEQEVRERILKDNQIRSAISVLKGVRVYKTLENK